jgi:hypothetical protein
LLAIATAGKAICEVAGDGSGGRVVELPPGGLAKKGVGPGDELNLDVMDGTIILINSMMV